MRGWGEAPSAATGAGTASVIDKLGCCCRSKLKMGALARANCMVSDAIGGLGEVDRTGSDDDSDGFATSLGCSLRTTTQSVRSSSSFLTL